MQTMIETIYRKKADDRYPSVDEMLSDLESLEGSTDAAGAKVESFFLHDLDISPCDACEACQTDPYLGCIIEDDMQRIYQ